MNVTAIIITALICATILALCLISRRGGTDGK